MIPKPLDEITEEDLNNLISSAVAERKTLEYKQQLPDTNDAGKREFLADVSSFANTAGGDLVFGMTESAGIPTDLPGVQIADTDQEILRFESSIRTGLSPRIRHSTRAVPLASGRYALIFRVEQSWYGPHRVVFKEDSRFYGRTSNGKYALDVTDLRNAFLLANSVSQKITAFRAERILTLTNGQTLAPLREGPKLVMHCIPLESFGGNPQFDVLKLDAVRPMYANRLSGYGMRINFDGAISIATPPSAYTQVFRNGVIEAVRVDILRNRAPNEGLIPSTAYEEAVFTYLPHCFEILDKLGCTAPVFVGITLIGVKGLRLAAELMTQLTMGETTPIDRDVLMLPEIIVDDLSLSPGRILKPTLDLVWNACGYLATPNIDSAGHWNHP